MSRGRSKAVGFLCAVILLSAPIISHAALELPSTTKMIPLQIDGLYRFMNFKEVTPLRVTLAGRTLQPQGEDVSYVFREREPVRVEFLNNSVVRLTRWVSSEEYKTNPSMVEFAIDELKDTDLEMITDAQGRNLETLYLAYTFEEVQLAARGRVRVRGRHYYGGTCSISNWGTGQCVRYIKMTEGISGSLGNGGAVAGNLARYHGYRPTHCENPRVGTIASWPGHVGKWDGSCWRTLPAIACKCNNGDPGRGRPTLCVIK